MKKVLLTVLVAASLVACNEKPQKVEDATVVEAQAAGDNAGEAADPTTEATQKQAEEAYNNLQEAAAHTSFTPTGDMEKDAETLVKLQLDLAAKSADGEDTQAEAKDVTGAIVKAGKYYTEKGTDAQFQKILSEKLAEGIKKLKMEKLGS